MIKFLNILYGITWIAPWENSARASQHTWNLVINIVLLPDQKINNFFFFFFISYIIFEIVFNRVHCITRSYGWCENVRETLCVEYKTTNAKDGV